MTKYEQHILQYQDSQFSPSKIMASLRMQKQDGYLLDINNQTTLESTKLIYLGLHPQLKITYKAGVINTNQEVKPGKLKPYLEKLMSDYQFDNQATPLPFSGGLVGYLAYDYVKDNIPNYPKVANPFNLDDAAFMLFTEVIAFNPETNQVTLIQNLPSGTQPTLTALKTELTNLQAQFIDYPELNITKLLTPKFKKPTYQKLIHKTIEHIYRGDIFQMILSNPLQGEATGDLLALYQQLQGTYHFYFSLGDFQTVTASPETLLRKIKTNLATFPLAGTRRRGKNKAEDQKFANVLHTDPKEIAEHNMLVDLGRNDLGAVSQFNSVHVTEHMVLKKYQQVMHLASTVESQISPDKSALDALNAVFPAGTLSGAPKVSAMKIIGNLEQQHRGIYGGTFGYLDFNGDCDFAIGIRLAHKKGKHLTVHSGAGIVADSIPDHEYQECFNKSRVIVNGLRKTTKTEVLNHDSLN
ncbi:anthranilate synthase component I family protein [Fructilactobacillus frigidiflavus]|uniref:anthranilate synthase component I family protein n=1 Tax=Fructilactobacillus frigidiflavus TaxID=3242688 RepID=UPI003757E863